MPIKIGIVGTGTMARAHADHFRRIPGVRLAVCCDVVPGLAEALAKERGVARAFICSIKTGKQEQPDIFRGAEIQAYLDACPTSAATGAWSKIPAWN